MCGLLYRRGAVYWLCLGERWEKQRLDLPCYAKKFQNGRMSIQLRVPISFPKTYRRFVSRLVIITYRRASDKHQTSHATIIGMKLIPIYSKLKKLSFAWEGNRRMFCINFGKTLFSRQKYPYSPTLLGSERPPKQSSGLNNGPDDFVNVRRKAW